MKILFALLLVATIALTGAAQNLKGLPLASDRAEKSAAVFRRFAALGADSVPFEVFRRAKGVAVFGRITQVNLLINKFSSGKGVLTLREGGGWSAPVFYSFASAGYELKFAGKKNFDVVLFIMNDETIELLKKGRIKPGKIAGEKFALGPVVRGKGADAVLQKAAIIYYTFENGELSGQEFQNDAVFNSVAIAPDNNLNKIVYQKKSRLVLTENKNNPAVPPAIESFRRVISESAAAPPTGK